MKKILYIVIILLTLGICSVLIYGIHNYYSKSGDSQALSEETIKADSTVENYIKADMAVMDTITDEYTFYESRIALSKPFNESDDPDIDEVTNVFQFLVQEGKDTNPNVYMFIHNKDGETIIEKHPGAFIVSGYCT